MNDETNPEITEPIEATEPTEPATAEPTVAPPTDQSTQQPVDRPSSWHRVHIPHLVMGLAFLGLVTVWALVVPLNAVELRHARWLLPLPWLVAGAAGLVATVLSGRRRS